ncbi:MAG: DUF4215 domain-containing protein [Spirochaetia bacterium]|nr:DUF4215 domain-containing protein [Spirochaetia bacterium]
MKIKILIKAIMPALMSFILFNCNLNIDENVLEPQQESMCGDGVKNIHEDCDDGNTITESCAYGETSCTVCDAACNSVAGAVSGYCGDGIINGTESCDDSNTISGDGCSDTCTNENLAGTCGDGIVQAGESCDDGNATSGDGCSDMCTFEDLTGVCGNGNIDAGESCDDGNLISGDGCSDMCLNEDLTGLGVEAGLWTSGCQTESWDDSGTTVYYSRESSFYFDGITFIFEELQWDDSTCGAKGTQDFGNTIRGDYTISATTTTALGINLTYTWDDVAQTEIVDAILSGNTYNAYDMDITFLSLDFFLTDQVQIDMLNIYYAAECGGNFEIGWNHINETCANALFIDPYTGEYGGPQLNQTMLTIMSFDGDILRMGTDYDLNGNRIDIYTIRQEYINEDNGMAKVY